MVKGHLVNFLLGGQVGGDIKGREREYTFGGMGRLMYFYWGCQVVDVGSAC